MGRKQRRRATAAAVAAVAASAPERKGARFAVGLVWAVVMVLIVAVIIFACMLLGGELCELLYRHDGTNQSWLVPVGGLAGALLGISICHLARGWVQRLRLSRLRHTGISATGRVTAFRDWYAANSRGPGMTTYHVTVSWTDESGPRAGERRFRFWGHGLRAFEKLTERGTAVELRYPPGRPERFIIDIPYAPTMADQFL